MIHLPRLACVCLFALMTTHSARANDADEDALKAAFIYNLLKFIELPRGTAETPGTPLRLCLLGITENQERSLRMLNGRSAQGRTIAVIDYAANGCHAVFAGDSVGAARLRALAEQGVLTIDGPGAVDNEGMVGLVNLEQRIRFEFNLGSARRANIRIPAQLLKLAARIKPD